MTISTLLLLLLLLVTYTKAQDCTGLPTTNFLRLRLQSLLINDGGEGGNIVVTVQDGPFYTCQVQGTTMGTHQELSVILTYTTNDDSNPRSRQFEMDCISAGGITDWDSRSGSLSGVLDASVDYSSLDTFTNCSRCTSSAGNDNHCQACDAACNVGLMRCTGTTATDCCVAFEDDGVCKADLNCNENNFVANEQNNFICACGLTSCGAGYTLDQPTCSCTVNDTCVANTPCANGNCSQGLLPTEYTCDCTGTNYNGVNCSVCSLTCGAGHDHNDDCTDCVLTDICKADDPCANGGSCTLNVSPSNYTCTCVNMFDAATDCKVCSLSCPTGYSNNSDCSQCIVSNICEADNPCKNGGTCSLDAAPQDYTCYCTNNFTADTDCTDCSLDCGNGYEPDSDCLHCVLVNVCEAIKPCQNGASCTNTSATSLDEYNCECVDNYGGHNCTDCGLVCLNNGTVDRYCRTCNCATGYAGTNCSECAHGYTKDRDTGACTMETPPRDQSGSSVVWWYVLVPIVVGVVLAVVGTIVAVGFIIKKYRPNNKVNVV